MEFLLSRYEFFFIIISVSEDFLSDQLAKKAFRVLYKLYFDVFLLEAQLFQAN